MTPREQKSIKNLADIISLMMTDLRQDMAAGLVDSRNVDMLTRFILQANSVQVIVNELVRTVSQETTDELQTTDPPAQQL